MSQFTARAARVSKTSARSGLRTALWFAKVTIPISLAMAILGYVGVVEWISVQLQPLFALLGLGGEAALVWLTTMFGNIYAGAAVMITVGVDFRSAIILAAMGLVCHNLIIETAIQQKTGASGLWMVILRIGASLLTGWLLHRIMPAAMSGVVVGSDIAATQAASWGEVIRNWALGLVPLLVRMFVLIVGLNVVQGLLREFRILDLLTYPLQPLMGLFGLPRSTSFLWLICNVIGLAYGGAALIDEIATGRATPREARLLNTHVAISHSMLEDTSIYAMLGIPVGWLIAPRVALAIVAVWVQRLGRFANVPKMITFAKIKFTDDEKTTDLCPGARGNVELRSGRR